MANSKNPHVLVTGATGRIGTLLRAAWVRHPPAFQPVWQTGRGQVDDGWVQWDMLATACPPIDPDPSVVLNLAGVGPSRPFALNDNVALAQAAHDAASRFGASHLFLASTAAIYGAMQAQAMTEAHAPSPRSAYGASKVAMEQLAQSWIGAAQGPAVTSLRIGNVVGADAVLGTAIPGKSVALDPVPQGDRGPERAWIGPQVLADALAALIDRALSGRSLPIVLNVAQSPALPMADLLDAASQPWHRAPNNPLVIPRVALDCRALHGVLGHALPTASASTLIADWRSLAGATG